jgi:periplasmic protein TonB
LANYLRENINYPSEAFKKNIEGRVIIGFVINKDGSISDIKTVKGIGYGCDEEAIRLVKNFSKFIPGTKEGKPARYAFYLPINFQL